MDDSWNICGGEEGLVAIATNYFRSIFESSKPEGMDKALGNISTTITDSMKQELTFRDT